MRIPKNISLDETTHALASEMEDFSGWVRTLLLLWDEIGRPDVGTVMRRQTARTWRAACVEMHRRTWGRANALRVIEHHTLGPVITDQQLDDLAAALEVWV